MYMRHFALASQIDFCENAHGGPSRVTEKVCSRKRRQSCSKVDSDNAHDPPDDPASRPSVKIEPTTSGLGQTWGNPGRRGTRRDTSRKRSEVQARRSRCASRLHALDNQSVAIIPRTRKSQATLIPQKNRGRESGPGTSLPYCLAPSFARSLPPYAFLTNHSFSASEYTSRASFSHRPASSAYPAVGLSSHCPAARCDQ